MSIKRSVKGRNRLKQDICESMLTSKTPSPALMGICKKKKKQSRQLTESCHPISIKINPKV